MKAVVFYESADDVMEKAPIHMEAHSAWFRSFHERGTLLMIGTFADPAVDGAMCVFADRTTAEEFVAGDPFVTNGVVKRYTIKDWNEILA
jgi:uncharacterized protein YciI